MQNIRPSRLFAAAALIVSCIALGLTTPLVLDLDVSEFRLSNVSVFAASRGGHEFTDPVDLAPVLQLRLERGTIAVGRAPGAVEGSHALPADGSGNLIIDSGVFQVGGGAADHTAAPTGSTAPLFGALKALNFEGLAIRRSTVNIVLPDGRIEKLSDVTAEVLANRKTTLVVRGTGNLRGQEVSFEITSAAAIDRNNGSRVPLKLRLKSELLDIVFDGQVGAVGALHLQGRIELSMSNVRRTARWLGGPWPSGSGLRDVFAKGDFDWQGQALSFDRATFRMDGNQATGTLALSFAGPRPALTGTLALQSLDLTPYTPSVADGQISTILAWARSNDGRLASPLGKQLDADIRVSAAQVLAGGMEFGRSAASLSLKQGRLLADIAEIGVDSGRASGQISADFSGEQPQLALRGRLEEIEASSASTALLGYSAVQGLSTITADVTAAGESISDLLDDVRGKITLSLQEGGRLGIDVKSLLAAAHKGDVEGWGAAIRGQTSVDELEAKLRVDKGVLASELVEATSGDSLMRAVGTISLRSRQMDLRLLLDAVPEAARPDLPRDVLVFRGSLASPSIQVER